MATNDNQEVQSASDSNHQLTADGKNAQMIICPNCRCKILLKKTAELVNTDIFLPYMRVKKNTSNQESGQVDGEQLSQFWKVDNMFTFENVGFTKTVGSSIKYLICADCEIGPIGWHDINDKTTFLIATQRIHYSD
ncbi:uncharacterized protein TRIADDRAFT_23935 [Trichoplax adhaerens]|uniref:Guanine nucleotide exchange factor MSS4 n=1 Tax=Trichoplax adhaerens TaxID=10228 RepID=B3RVB9_TRIAD|nr:hypothetical protein TRIADDRAFT_23935 [Trichoplax adhaerens]EDV25476.1 hypothetical protein TRIADDRAFT_23935 [Trichoplax adhaerens]|eukprot:XP_002111509.1 hypothetical protein TRIADDRAFT_23935 [Trichoplax adhaerens]